MSALPDDTAAPDQAPGETLGLIGLTSVSCASADFCVAVDALGRSLTFNGRTWTHPTPIGTSVVDVPNGRLAAIAAVACPTTQFCAAVSASGDAQVSNDPRHHRISRLVSSADTASAYNGRFPALSGVSCTRQEWCVAISYTGSAFVLEGSSWKNLGLIDSALAPPSSPPVVGATPIACPAAAWCVALDAAGHAVTFNGSAWSSPSTVEANVGFQSLSCASPSFCVAIDDTGRLATFAGAAWSLHIQPPSR